VNACQLHGGLVVGAPDLGAPQCPGEGRSHEPTLHHQVVPDPRAPGGKILPYDLAHEKQPGD
jgi:hypothetical protein